MLIMNQIVLVRGNTNIILSTWDKPLLKPFDLELDIIYSETIWCDYAD